MKINRIDHIRSLLFCPANKEKMFDTALNSKADIVIFDFEDSVSTPDKQTARNILSDWFNNQEKHVLNRIAVRINSIDTKEGKLDIEFLSNLKNQPKFVVIPKMATQKQVLKAIELIDDKNIEFILLIETAKGVLNIEKILYKTDRVAFVMIGSADLSSDIGCNNNRTALQYANSKIILTSSAKKIPVIDSPFFTLNNKSAFEQDTELGKSFGFSARSAIHPQQTGIINNVFSYTEKQVNEAKEIIEIANKGVGSLNGKMIDEAMAKKAREIINTSTYIKK